MLSLTLWLQTLVFILHRIYPTLHSLWILCPSTLHHLHRHPWPTSALALPLPPKILGSISSIDFSTLSFPSPTHLLIPSTSPSTAYSTPGPLTPISLSSLTELSDSVPLLSKQQSAPLESALPSTIPSPGLSLQISPLRSGVLVEWIVQLLQFWDFSLFTCVLLVIRSTANFVAGRRFCPFNRHGVRNDMIWCILVTWRVV